MAYIDAEKLKAEIERLKKHSQEAKMEFMEEGYSQNAFAEDRRLKSFDKLLSFITSLQQERPECIYGRTLEERKKCCKFCSAICEARIEQDQSELDVNALREWSMRFAPDIRDAIVATAYHFWNKALNSKKDVDLEKEIEEHVLNMPHCEFSLDSDVYNDEEWARKEFRHFYQRGLNARKEE